MSSFHFMEQTAIKMLNGEWAMQKEKARIQASIPNSEIPHSEFALPPGHDPSILKMPIPPGVEPPAERRVSFHEVMTSGRAGGLKNREPLKAD
jgi:hypothetical protein